ncbi:MAG: HD domain-containing protein [Clostridia bacterium]|nr:HD domain-containing protein [Clostridia bacterium]
MIDDIQDLSVIRRQKKEKQIWFSKNFWAAFVPMLILSIGCFAFALFIADLNPAKTHNFLDNFSLEYLGDAISTLICFGIVFATLFFAFFALNRNNRIYKLGRNYILCSIVVAMNYLAIITVSTLLKGVMPDPSIAEATVFLLPMSFTALVIVELIGRREAMICTFILTVLTAFTFTFTGVFEGYNGNLVLISILSNMISAILILFLVSQNNTRLKFIVGALGGAIIATIMDALSTVAVGALSKSSWQPMDILWNSVFGFGGNFVSILVFMPFVAIFEGIFNIADNFKLDELTNLNNPLLKRLASEAPGTFNHSLVVGNLADACAQAIGENPHLARCAAYYHDVGKLKSPEYFAENQSTYNPHDELIPEVSVRMITSHTMFGEILLKQYHMPKEICDIARQHHGTAPVGYFYRKALSLTEGDLDMQGYVYAGPKPQTKVAAIIMIADTCEAAFRAYMPETKEGFEEKINQLVDEKISLRQFDECPITMGDIATIKKTIMEVLPSVHHSRVDYDKDKR